MNLHGLHVWVAFHNLLEMALAFEEYNLPLSHPRKDLATETERLLFERQSLYLPPATTQPNCPMYNGFFYTTPENSTFQLQCYASYTGVVVGQTNTSDYAACISTCESLNTLVATGTCIGATFNGTNDSTMGTCTGYTKIAQVLDAQEKGAAYGSALLISGADGNEYAAPVQDVPVSAPLATALTQLSGSILASRPSIASPSPVTISNPETISIATAISLPTLDDGPRPINPLVLFTSESSGSLQTYGQQTPSNTISNEVTKSIPALVQRSFTMIIPITIYAVQVTEICQPVSSTCALVTVPARRLISGHRYHVCQDHVMGLTL